MIGDNNKKERLLVNEETLEKHDDEHSGSVVGYWGFVVLETALLVLYSQFVTFGELSDPKLVENNSKSQGAVIKFYPFFQDVNVMIFVGFGFLMTFLRKFSWSAVSKNFIISCVTIQLAVLSIDFWKMMITGKWEVIGLSIEKLIDADFCAGSILIAFGAVIGKLSLIQYLVMACIQVVFYGLFEAISTKVLFALDIGGSVSIHMFGAYYGLTVAFMMRKEKHADGKTSFCSNLYAMIGTLFLWMYWPSFNAAMSSGISQHRIIINTILSLTASCITVFLLTAIKHKGKLHMENILNATLAGGVIIGSSSDLIAFPSLTFAVGILGGLVSFLGYEFIGPYLLKHIGLHDTCGVHSLHGMPGLVGGIVAFFVVMFTATKENFGEGLLEVFPKLDQRTRYQQAGIQVAHIAIGLGIAILAGVITGFILSSSLFSKVWENYEDENQWSEEPIEEITNDQEKKLMKKIEERFGLKQKSE